MRKKLLTLLAASIFLNGSLFVVRADDGNGHEGGYTCDPKVSDCGVIPINGGGDGFASTSGNGDQSSITTEFLNYLLNLFRKS